MTLNRAYMEVHLASPVERRSLFADAGRRRGISDGNAEKDFWVCLALDVLFNGLEGDHPRLLVKGGTSLSKAHGLIARFSEDIDIFREDLGQASSVAELAALSGKKRRKRLDEIRAACQEHVNGRMLDALRSVLRRGPFKAGSPIADVGRSR